MAVGIIVPLPAYTLNPAFIARKAEVLGFESIWYHEHPILPVDSASPFPATGGGVSPAPPPLSQPPIFFGLGGPGARKIKNGTRVAPRIASQPPFFSPKKALLGPPSHQR